MTGESTPGYALLDDAGMAWLRALNPNVKLIFTMRDPVRRAWSALMNAWIKRGATGVPPNAEEALALAFMPYAIARSTYIDTVERLDRLFPASNVHYGFYDDLSDHPETFVRGILDHLGVDSTLAGRLVGRRPTRSSTHRAVMPSAFERAYAERILPSVERLCVRFEGPPHAWRDRYVALLGR